MKDSGDALLYGSNDRVGKSYSYIICTHPQEKDKCIVYTEVYVHCIQNFSYVIHRSNRKLVDSNGAIISDVAAYNISEHISPRYILDWGEEMAL